MDAELLFREKDHVYMLGGNVIPSVSELCAPLHRETYKDVPKWQLEAAAERGTAVHVATQALDTAGVVSCDEEYVPYVMAYRDFLSKYRPLWSLTEKAMYHTELRYAGTPDRYGTVDGKLTLLDIKTTATVYKHICRAQLNLYRLILIERGFPVEQMVILHLKKDGTYKLVEIKEDVPLAMALITIYNALPKRRRKGVKNV
jgi:hypothetical protein